MRRNVKRERVLVLIQYEYSVYGKCTTTAMRLYIENRISREVYDENAQRGLRYYDNHPETRRVDC